METRTILDYITNKGCSVKTEKYIVDGGKEYVAGQPERVAYSNSADGRDGLKRDHPAYFEALRLTVWGDEPTVTETDMPDAR